MHTALLEAGNGVTDSRLRQCLRQAGDSHRRTPVELANRHVIDGAILLDASRSFNPGEDFAEPTADALCAERRGENGRCSNAVEQWHNCSRRPRLTASTKQRLESRRDCLQGVGLDANDDGITRSNGCRVRSH